MTVATVADGHAAVAAASAGPGQAPRLIKGAAELSTTLDDQRRLGSVVGIVPTMGALHDGHLSLVRRARSECDVTVVTIFVNPLQFDEERDLEAYPRPMERDLAVLGEESRPLVFAPTGGEMFPEAPLTTVRVAALSDHLEGRSRPGHLEGVATVVTKLLSIAGRCRAYFGEKDYQQLTVVRRLVRDLSLPVTIVGCPTVREDDGLAASSRNSLLEGRDRSAAGVLYKALLEGRSAIEAGERAPSKVRSVVAAKVASEPLASLDYAEVVEAGSLQVPSRLTGEVRLLVAARFGDVRLIDNIGARAT